MGLFDNTPGASQGDRTSAMLMALASGAAAITGNQPVQQNIQSIVQRQQQLRQGNRTMQEMQKAGVDPQLIAMAQGNPDLMKTMIDGFVKQRMGINKHMIKYSTPRIDENTGQYYVIATDPNTNTTKRINVEDATGITAQQKLEMESQSQVKQMDVEKAINVGHDAFQRAGMVSGIISKLESARESVFAGANTGIIAKYIPSFNAATANLKEAANLLGIDIINMATFGALSEKELSLALSTGLDLSLQGEELVKHIDAKISAQSKLRDKLLQMSRDLTSGNTTFSGYIQEATKDMIKRSTPIPEYQTPGQTGGYTITQQQVDNLPAEQQKLLQDFFKSIQPTQ